MIVNVPVSPGELIDKMTILEIKSERITDEARLAHVATELAALTRARDSAFKAAGLTTLPPTLIVLSADLKAVNATLWEIEDDIRACERAQDFGARFIELARAVYITNDKRSALKQEINRLLGSALTEVKSYAKY